jgi:predicted nucleic acid-binding protein
MTQELDYADSSLLMSLLAEDANTVAAEKFMARHPAALAFNPLHRLEVRNGLRLRVHRGDIDTSRRATALRHLDEAIEGGKLVHVPLPWTDALRKAEQLSAAHAEKIGNRSADTLHVAAAMLSGARHFLSFDKRQRELAKAAGLEVKP